jgi:hypothetical protein
MYATRRALPLCGLLATLLVGGLLTAVGCRQGPTPPAPVANAGAADAVPAGPDFFRDVTADTGIAFTYRNGEEALHYAILESLGGGVALIDFDGDGLLDIFLPGGGYFDKKHEDYQKDPTHPPRILGHPCKLYKNLGGFKFKDVTKEAGLDKIDFYTHGCAVADYDRDGWPDLLVTGWGRLALFRNVPVDDKDPSKGRKFVEVSKQVGLPEGLWTTSAAWADLDGDGYPDLYVCQYADWGFGTKHPIDCTYDGKTRDVCPPKKFLGIPHKLFRNNAGKSFTDVSKEAGLRVPRKPEEYDLLTDLPKEARERLKRAETDDTGWGKGLGVVIADFNGDRKPDVYVANDTVDNFLYVNRGKAKGKLLLEELGMESGTARDQDGVPNGSMGVDAADYDGSGRPSIWVTNYEQELHALYRNECRPGREFFLFATQIAGIAAVGRDTVGWGTGFVDIDHHGWEDLFFTAGHAIRHPKGNSPRAQRSMVLRNLGNGKFKDWSSRGGDYFRTHHVGRGVALGDLDNDGRIDVVLNNLNEPAAVLRNVADTTGNHWLGVELKGKDHADVVGARVVVEAGGRTQTRFAKGGGSYASSGDRRHVIGLGPADKIDKLTVVWPSGKEQHWTGLKVDGYWRLTEGEEKAQPGRAAAK